LNATRLALVGMLALAAGMPTALAHAGAHPPAARGADSPAAVPQVQPPKQDFVANPAGSYRLPVLQQAANGWVLDGSRVPRRLSRYTHGAVTLLSFVYTYCSDPIGCPLAYATMADLKSRVLADTSLHGKVRFVSLSFDPTNDTPDAMRLYGAEHAKSTALPWHFLTTYSPRFLLPILDGYGQDVEVELDAKGAPTRARTHMLKLFLIDPGGGVREIYSAAFLHPEVMFNDIKTLVMEAPASARQARP
jgi:protein SCO1/2